MEKKGLELLMAVLLLAGVLALSREVVNVMSDGETVSKVILVDPGHGGDDPGMIGIDNLKEKDINLQISLKLKTCLEEAGYQVVMTRDTDEGLYDAHASSKKAQDMQRRCEMITESAPCLSVSIHQNSYSDSAVKGPQVFYYKDSAEGERLAKALQDKLNTYLEVERPRVVKGNTSYYLLKRSKGILNIVECGFLTNPDEAYKLTDEAYQQKVADAICAGIREYLGEEQ